MLDKPFDYRRFFFLGLLAYVVLGLLAWVYWQERTCFVDLALHLFELVTRRGFAIQGNRFVAAATQSIPLAGVQLGVSLSQLALSYSVSFALFYAVCYGVCGPVLGQYRVASLFLFSQTLLTADTFYWIQSELPQGLSLLIVLIALLQVPFRGKVRRVLLGLAIGGTTLTVGFSHPLLLFPALYACVFLGLATPAPPERRKWLLAGLSLLAAFLLKRLFFQPAYDDRSTPDLQTFYNQIGYITHAEQLRIFLLDCLRKFYAFPLLLVLASVHYIRQKQYGLFVLLTLGSLGYVAVILATHPDADTPAFYMENLLLPLGLFIALPLVYHLLPAAPAPVRTMAAIGLLAVGVTRIAAYHTAYTVRLKWMNRFIAQHKTEKLIVPQACVPMDTVIITWGTPYETWLLSTLGGGRTASLLITDHPQDYQQEAGLRDAFLPSWGVYPYRELPRRYFRFTDSVTAYRLVAAP